MTEQAAARTARYRPIPSRRAARRVGWAQGYNFRTHANAPAIREPHNSRCVTAMAGDLISQFLRPFLRLPLGVKKLVSSSETFFCACHSVSKMCQNLFHLARPFFAPATRCQKRVRVTFFCACHSVSKTCSGTCNLFLRLPLGVKNVFHQRN